MKSGTAFIAMVLTLGPAFPSAAADQVHLVGAEESLETVAKNYYGATWKVVYLRSRNRLTDNEEAFGKRIVIPASWLYAVRRGDSLASIAKRRLGDADRHRAVMAFNNIKDPTDLAAGTSLLMPFHLTHVVAANETLAKISLRYYRTSRRANLIKDYNKVEAIQPGDRLTIPIFDSATVDARSRAYTVAARKPGSPPPRSRPQVVASPEPAGDRARAQLKAAVDGFRSGAFDSACGEMETLLESNALDDSDKMALFKHLGFCAVAFDDLAAARDYFKKWVESDPKASLDPISTSPKILAVFREVAPSAAAETKATTHPAEPSPLP